MINKRKTGLQKEVSKIFTGIQIPRKDVPEAGPYPAAPSPAKRVEPKPVPATPRPFTIPEPEQHTQPTPKAISKVYEPPVLVKKVSEPPAPAQKVYEPPAPVQNVYEPPAPAPAPVRQPRPEPPPKPHLRIPGLKIWETLKGKLLTPKAGVNPGRQKAMVLLIPVLFVVFVFVLFKVLRTPSAPSTEAANNVAASAIASFNSKIDWELPPPYPENLRDAMVFGPATQIQEENKDKPVVKGIVYSEDNPCAVVGDRIVSAGDVVQGATVVKINPDSVEFTKGDESWTQKVER